MKTDKQVTTLIDKIKGTIGDFKKKESLETIHQRVDANKKKFDNLKTKRRNFQEGNKDLLDDYSKKFVIWKEQLSESDQISDKCKEAKWYVDQLLKPIEERPSEDNSNIKTSENKKQNTQNKPIEKQQQKTDEIMNNVDQKSARNKNSYRNKSVNSNPSKVDVDLDRIKNELGRIENLISGNILHLIKDIGKPASDIKLALDSAKSDLSVKLIEISRQEKILKEIQEAVEPIPAKFKKIDEKMESLGIKVEESLSGSTAKYNELPTDEKSVIELTKYMRDGLDELENIARYYVQKEAEFSKLQKNSEQQDRLIEDAREEGRVEGSKAALKKLAKEFQVKYPTEFEKAYTIFGDLITAKYSKGNKIPIDADNRQILEIEIEGIDEETEYNIDTPALLLEGEVIKKATAHKAGTKEQ